MIIWKENERPYANGQLAYLGPFKVGSIYWDSSTRSASDPWAARVHLPGCRHLKNSASRADARARVERVVAMWVRKAGLQPATEGADDAV